MYKIEHLPWLQAGIFSLTNLLSPGDRYQAWDCSAPSNAGTSFLFLALYSSRKTMVIHMVHIPDTFIQDRDQEYLQVFQVQCRWASGGVSMLMFWLLFVSQIAATDHWESPCRCPLYSTNPWGLTLFCKPLIFHSIMDNNTLNTW